MISKANLLLTMSERSIILQLGQSQLKSAFLSFLTISHKRSAQCTESVA